MGGPFPAAGGILQTPKARSEEIRLFGLPSVALLGKSAEESVL